MHIANPIYDIVFKYLLEDNELAKLLLSTIIEDEITELEFRPQERSATVGSRCLTVYRLDFAAKIKNAQGVSRQVLIEIQKAKLATDIMRFRRYLGEQYRDANNTIVDATGLAPNTALPLLTIYFLGHSLKYTKAPVIRVKRECFDLTTGAKLTEKEPFIESLTHDSYVIQIMHLAQNRQIEMEEMLQIFDQGRICDDKHLLQIDETDIPERYRPILRRLQRAVAEPEVADAMDLEDEVLAELQTLERSLEKERGEKEEERREKEKAVKERDQEKREKEKAEKEKEKAEKENERLLAVLKKAGIEF